MTNALDNWLERQNKRTNAWNNTKAHLEELKEEILLIIPDINLVNKMFVAGGAIRSLITETKVSDYDIFFKDSDGIQELKEALAYREVLYQSKNSIGLITSTGKHVQFIIITSGSPESVVGEFDFTCNQNYYEFLTKSLTVSTDTYTMTLRINSNARNAMGTFLRIGKFLDKGYTYPPREDMIALGVKMTQQEPITTYEELDESSKMNFKREELNKVQEIIDIGGFDLRVTSVSRVGSNGGEYKMIFNKRQMATIIVQGSRYGDQLSEVEQKLGDIISSSFSTLANISPDSALEVITQLNHYVEVLKNKSIDDKKVLEDTITKIEQSFNYREE